MPEPMALYHTHTKDNCILVWDIFWDACIVFSIICTFYKLELKRGIEKQGEWERERALIYWSPPPDGPRWSRMQVFNSENQPRYLCCPGCVSPGSWSQSWGSNPVTLRWDMGTLPGTFTPRAPTWPSPTNILKTSLMVSLIFERETNFDISCFLKSGVTSTILRFYFASKIKMSMS